MEAVDWRDFRRKEHWALGARPARSADKTPVAVGWSGLRQEAPIVQHHGPDAVAWHEAQRSGQ